MPDYSLCMQKECPKAQSCCRFLGIPGHYQSYIAPKFDENGCEYFWDWERGAPFELKGER